MKRFTSFCKKWWPLLIIFFLALFIRSWHLGQLPATFFEDEALSGYLGRYLWANGIDLYGNHWPLLYFNKFGDFYIILPMYLDGLSTYVFGMTWMAVRFPTALIGALSIFPVAALSYLTFKSRKVAVLSALFLALFPWHIVLSRATTESVIELFLLLWVVVFLMWGWQKQRWYWLLLAMGISFLSYFVYHTSRLLVPLLWLGGIAVYWTRIKSQKVTLIVSVVGLLLLAGLTLYIGSTPWGKGRFSQTSVFSEQSGVQGRIQEMIYNLGPDSAVLARLVHNKPLGFGRELFHQYVSYFSPLYLFTTDGWNATRYAVPEAGPVLVTYGLILLTLLIPTKRRFSFDAKGVLFLVWMMIISVIPASLTVIESPSIRRSIVLVVPICIFAAYAFYRSWSIKVWRIPLGLGLLSLLLAEWALFAFLYVKQSDRVTSVYRSDGYPELAKYVVENQAKYDHIYVANKSTFPLYYLFTKQDFSRDWSQRFGLNFSTESIDNVVMSTSDCPSSLFDQSAYSSVQTKEKILYIDERNCDFPNNGLTQVGSIEGVNPLLGFRLFQPTALDSETKSTRVEPLVPLNGHIQ